MRGAQTNPPCISFKIGRLNHKSLNGWLSQPGSTQNTINKKITTIFLKKLVVTYPQTFYNVSVKCLGMRVRIFEHVCSDFLKGVLKIMIDLF